MLADEVSDVVLNDDFSEALDRWVGLDAGVADPTWDVAFRLPDRVGFRVVIDAPGTKYDRLIGYQVGPPRDGLITVRLNDQAVTRRKRLVRLPIGMTTLWLGEQRLSDFQERQLGCLFDSISIDPVVRSQLHVFGAVEKGVGHEEAGVGP